MRRRRRPLLGVEALMELFSKGFKVIGRFLFIFPVLGASGLLKEQFAVAVHVNPPLPFQFNGGVKGP
jgi:hypothetical protein